MKKVIISIDQGTTGTTALLINAENFELIGKVNHEFDQIFPKPSWVEHNLNDIWHTVCDTTRKVLLENNISPKQVVSIGITNQRETTCAYSKDGTPLANAIVWQDRRTNQYCIEKQNSYGELKKKTGLPLDPYFSGTKMNWLLNNNPDVISASQEDNLCLSTIDTFLLYKMSGHKSFKTEPSNASRTLLMNLDSTTWDSELLSFFEINEKYLPQIVESFGIFGTTEGLDFLPDGVPISCILGDQQAALFGQAGFNAGDLKCTYGTGAFILLNTGPEKVYSSHGLLTTVAFKHKGKTIYALEGSSYIAGAAVQWLRDNLKAIASASQTEAFISEVTDEEMEHLLFMPFFTGIGSPHWRAEAKATITGITRDTNQKHLTRACLEGMALSINDSIMALVTDSKSPVTSIKVDGGACLNDYLMQFQANISKKIIVRPQVIETTAYGVAIGSQIGLDNICFNDIANLWKENKTFSPQEKSYSTLKLNQWSETVKRFYL